MRQSDTLGNLKYNETVMEQNQKKSEVLPTDWKDQIYAAEATRVNSMNPAEYETLIQQLDVLRALLDRDPTGENFTGILSIIRLKATTQMQLASASPSLQGHVEHLLKTREVIVTDHGNEALFEQAKTVHEGLRGEKLEFMIELARDVAKYLDKVARVTGDTSFHELAAKVLNFAIDRWLEVAPIKTEITFRPENEAYALAQFERLIQVDLSQVGTVNADELFYYVQALADLDADAEGNVQNWDRQAAVGWWLYEYGVRHQDRFLKQFGLERVNKATLGQDIHAAPRAEQLKRKAKKLSYIAKRLVANAFEIGRRAQFNLKSSAEQTEIKQKLALPEEG